MSESPPTSIEGDVNRYRDVGLGQSFEQKQIPQDHGILDLDRIHHGPNSSPPDSSKLTKQQSSSSKNPSSITRKQRKLEKNLKLSKNKGSKVHDVILLKKRDSRTIMASDKRKIHAWDIGSDDGVNNLHISEVDSFTVDTITLTKTTGTPNPDLSESKRGFFRTKSQKKLQTELSKSQRSSRSTISSVLRLDFRLDEEEVDEDFTSAKIRQGIENARKNRSTLQRWKTPYEIDAPRTITVHHTRKREQAGLTPSLPTYLPKFPAREEVSTTDSAGSNDSESRTTEQKIWNGIEILLAEAFSEGDDTSTRSHMSELEDILPGQLLRAMCDRSITGSSIKSTHVIDDEPAMVSLLKKAVKSDEDSDEIEMAQAALNSFMDLLLPDFDKREAELGTNHGKSNPQSLLGSQPQPPSTNDGRGERLISQQIAHAEVALNNFMDKLLGTLEDDLLKEPQHMSPNEQLLQYRRIQSTLTLFEVFRWSLQVNVDATERQLYAENPNNQGKGDGNNVLAGTSRRPSMTRMKSSCTLPSVVESSEEKLDQEVLIAQPDWDTIGGMPIFISNSGSRISPTSSPDASPQQCQDVPSWAAIGGLPIVMSNAPAQKHSPTSHGVMNRRVGTASPAPSNQSSALPSSFLDGKCEDMRLSDTFPAFEEYFKQKPFLQSPEAFVSDEMPDLASMSSAPSYESTLLSFGQSESIDPSLSIQKHLLQIRDISELPSDSLFFAEQREGLPKEMSKRNKPQRSTPHLTLKRDQDGLLEPSRRSSQRDLITFRRTSPLRQAVDDIDFDGPEYSPYGSVCRPKVSSAAGDIFTDDVSQPSLEIFVKEFGLIGKRRGANDAIGHPPVKSALVISSNISESVEDDLTIDSTLKADYRRCRSLDSRDGIREVSGRWKGGKQRRGFFGTWAGSIKNLSSRRLGSLRSQSLKHNALSTTKRNNQKTGSASTAFSSIPTIFSSTRVKGEEDVSMKCLMHGREKRYDQGPIVPIKHFTSF